jgi:hypothetical protein
MDVVGVVVVAVVVEASRTNPQSSMTLIKP